MNKENKIKTSIEQEKLENELTHKKYELENLNRLIEEHKKETHPYKRYEFESTSYTLLLIDINNLLEENQELKQQIIIMEKYFELINNISFDYDGYNDVAGLKGVINELNRFANLGRACNTTEPIYESDGVKFNILLQKLPEQEIGGKE